MGWLQTMETLCSQNKGVNRFIGPSKANDTNFKISGFKVTLWCTYELRHTKSFGIERDRCAESKWNVISKK